MPTSPEVAILIASLDPSGLKIIAVPFLAIDAVRPLVRSPSVNWLVPAGVAKYPDPRTSSL